MTATNTENTTAGDVASQPTAPTAKRRSIFSKILMVFAAVIGVFLIVVAIQPSDFRIVRSTTVDAPPATVFAQVNDFHKWNEWSPWAKLDPTMKQTFEGPATGKDASYAWIGNNEVGEGRMTIMDSLPNSLIVIKLEFLKPFQATNTTVFNFKLEGKQTIVTWTMAGQHNFVGKAMCLLMNMDKMVGGQFEEGLARMKAIAETEARKPGVS